jgi:thiazole synthase ThiGH ThiG subunit
MATDMGGSGVGLGNNGTGRQIPSQANYSITVNAGVGDPEAIARTLEDYIRQSYQRGTSSTGLLAV